MIMDAVPRLDYPPVAPRPDPAVPRHENPFEGTEKTASRAGTPNSEYARELPLHEERAPRSIEEPALDFEEIREFVDRLAAALAEVAPEPRVVHFRAVEESEDVVIEVRNWETGELITQIPPEKILNLRARLDELVGTVVDRKI
jgi:uncharacterized FlaG/YvyC family protein